MPARLAGGMVGLMEREIERIRGVAVAAAPDVLGRDKDGSFLEKTLRNALVEHLPGEVEVELRLGLATWSAGLGGVDVVYDLGGHGGPVGIETKVWDVEDALFDLLKLAAGTQRGGLRMGYSVIAARPRDWQRSSVVALMSSRPHAAYVSTTWSTAELLTAEAKEWRRIWHRSSARPNALPASIATFATAPVAMPRASGHEIRIIGVCALGEDQILLDEDGVPGGTREGDPSVSSPSAADGLLASVEAGIDRARRRPPGAIFYSDLTPKDKIRELQALLAERPDLADEIAGYISGALRQRDA
jgi:hypothetical protein